MRKRFLSLLLALTACLAMMVPALADLTPTEELHPDQYRLENGVLTVLDGVEHIGDHAFEKRGDLIRVELPASVEKIGAYSFSACHNLTFVSIAGEGGLEIDNSSFSGCRQMTLDLGGRYISWLSGSGYSFSGCEQLTSLDLSHLDWIPKNAFDGAGLVSVVISEGAGIGWEAFARCDNLVSVTIPASVTSIGEDAFTVEEMVPNENGGYVATRVPNPNLTIYGEAGSYAETYALENGLKFAAGPAPAAPVTPTPDAPVQPAAPALTATPTASTVLVNGANVAFDACNIGGANYFKLRDLAYVLNGTEKQFEVSWDGAANAISLISGQPYTAVGGEMTAGSGAAQTATHTSSKILLDGVETALDAYNIGGNNYFKLRDIGQAFDFGVDWDGAANTIILDTAKGYTA